MSLPIHHIPIEDADLRSAELLEAVAERGEIVVFYRDGVPVAEMSPVEPAPPSGCLYPTLTSGSHCNSLSP